ncbi:MAG: ABC transporter permease [Acidobacteria bacterium]|nr:ABC transporter permease [Acidobacteriota bacterium]
MRWQAFRELLLDRLRQFHREPEVIFWVYLFPLLLIAGLGVAFSEDGPKPVLVRVVADSPERTAELARQLASPEIETETAGLDQLDRAGMGGRWDLTIVARDGGVEYRLDPQQPESRLARELADRALQQSQGRVDPVSTTTVAEVRPGSRYIDWVIPGLLGLNILGSSMWGVGFTLVDLRIRKVLKRLSATPMRHGDFLLALLASRMLFLALEVVAILAFGRLVFHMPIVGDPLSIAGLCFLGACSFSAISLLTGARADKLETVTGLMNAIQVPMWIASGVFFSADRFPPVVQPLIQLLPLTQLNNGLRAILLEGHNLLDEAAAVGVLSAWGIVCFAAALRLFRWQ